jgi:anti-sigma B factor antagonist
MTLLTLQTEIEGPTARLALHGELDVADAQRVESELLRLEALCPSVLVLDLRGLTFISSTGLRIVLAADDRARENGRRMVVVRPPDAVRRVFAIANDEHRLEIVDDPATTAREP